MRTFIGIDFDVKVKDGIKAVQSIVRESSRKGRFKYMGNFHLTLKFLGEISEEQIPSINKVLEASAKEVGSFGLNIEDIGFFGGKGNIRTLWLGLGGSLASLDLLYKKIEEGLEGCGFDKEKRPYMPHITIAQDLILKTGFAELRESIDLKDIPVIDAEEVSLIKSEEIQGKRIYTPISTFRLTGK
ncbi:RNA 2',3'-cyclic phosphodiesterase [Lutispora saccharofermentans]|uniref:RNA 2',3'-cyclic phosphodiesterase n=1 Tax=Lutispora saccharofermentans TaxID=3024236 RepID=A0ABT1NFH4_9FIRM|nr:RNA 2',3'-cyclic phosphodiesterase [Lutispora saccharofermentans]MCQ1529994.1 RNA 2',3'-cyclic phosphodiesterase [Lutispora saccharofermentans]